MLNHRRYWWVNQNQTFKQEQEGGYLWSPKHSKGGRRNPSYDFMREVSPGDIIFCFYKQHIPAIGIAQSHAYEAPKPQEFGNRGAYWESIGWRIDVRYIKLSHLIRPSHNIDRLIKHLPKKYFPLQANGHGMQSIYLAFLNTEFAAILIDLIGRQAHDIVNALSQYDPANPLSGAEPAVWDEWEDYQVDQVQADTAIPDTDRQSIITARRGQGLFRQRVMQIERHCRVTGVDREEHLRASHIKPWRSADNSERLSGENGLLLTPSIDHLFDRGFISFEDDGRLLISPVAHHESLYKMGIPREPHDVGRFEPGQKQFLEHHRNNIYLASSYLDNL